MSWLRDLREYLAALDRLGDVDHVTKPVSADLEAAAFTRYSTEMVAPAPLFENVIGVAPGFRLFGAPAALSSAPGAPLARVALSLGLPAEATAAEVVDTLVRVRGLPPIPPRLVTRDQAPCKQNVLRGADATLDRFPVPRLHQHDGGRYPNSWGVVVAKTPDGRWTNWGISRVMQLDATRMAGVVSPPQHLGLIWQEWAALDKPMPYALVQGGAPAVPFAGGLPLLPEGVDEVGFIGALHGEPFEVVRCETVDLEVPATAEIVIEGHVSVGRDATEGPFGEFAGYASSVTTEHPVFTIEAITHRDDPIWPIVPEGRPVDEYHTVSGSGLAAAIVSELRAAGLPISTAWLPLRAASHWSVITVPRDWRNALPGVSSEEFTRRIAAVLQPLRVGMFVSHHIVLDDDVDSANDTDLLWALAGRVHPTERKIVNNGPINPLLGCYTAEEKRTFHGPIVVHDALQPAEGEGREPHSSFAQAYPEHIRHSVLEYHGQ